MSGSGVITPLNVEVLTPAKTIKQGGRVNVNVCYDPEIIDAINKHERSRTIGAGVLGGVIGLAIGGPVFCAITGLGTMYCARAPPNSSAAGDAARAMGDVALKARDKAIDIDNKHRVVDGSKKIATETLGRAIELNREYLILEKNKRVCLGYVESVYGHCRFCYQYYHCCVEAFFFGQFW